MGVTGSSKVRGACGCMCACYLSGMYVRTCVYVTGVCGHLVLQSGGVGSGCMYTRVQALGVSCTGARVQRCADVKVWGAVCGWRQCACVRGSCLCEAVSSQPGLEGCFPRPGCCLNRGHQHEHMRRGSEAHSWALTHTDAQGQTYPPLSSLFLSPGVSGFQRSLHEDCLLCSSPHPPACASSNTVMPSRQLCGGSCLNRLKADGWVEIRCCPPGSEEAAPLLWPGHRLRQMDNPPSPFSTPPHRVWGWAGTPPRRGVLAGSS